MRGRERVAAALQQELGINAQESSSVECSLRLQSDGKRADGKNDRSLFLLFCFVLFCF